MDLWTTGLRTNANPRIILEKTDKIFTRYDSTSGKVEIVKSGVAVGSW